MNTIEIIDHCRKCPKPIELLFCLQKYSNDNGEYYFCDGTVTSSVYTWATKIERVLANLDQRFGNKKLDLIKVSYSGGFNLYLGFWNDGVLAEN